MRAFVTGVTGQDGWYLSALLGEQGCEVYGLVASDDPAQLPPGVRPIAGDMRDAPSLRRALAACDPDEVYNLASLSSVAQSWREPELVADVNGMGALRLLDALRERTDQGGRPVRFVQASSAEIFGDAPAPQDESTRIAPVTPYGAAKAFAQHAVAAYRAAGVWASSVILFNHESPRRPPEFVTRKITAAAARIAAGHGGRLALGNLDARRDWGFAGDYAAAMTLVARHGEPSDFVIATGSSHTIAEFVAAAFARVAIDDWRAWVDVDAGLQRAGDASEQRGNPARARAVLGWRPTVDFDRLVAMMVDADLTQPARSDD